MLNIDKILSMRVKDMFPGKKINDHYYKKRYRYIQISTPTENMYVHYEYTGDKIELHFEGNHAQYDEMIKYLKIKTKDKKDFEWSEWGHGCRCVNKQSLNNENLKLVSVSFVESFDNLMGTFINCKNQKMEVADSDNVVLTDNLSLKEVLELPLSIPDYQRIYCWEDKNVKDLWSDLMEMPSDKESHLGAIILHLNNNEYDIIDGQQRLVTLTLILRGLGYDEPISLSKKRFNSSDAINHIANAKALIKDLTQEFQDDGRKKQKDELIRKIIEKLSFSLLIIKGDNLDLAYTFFSNQNSKGVPLSDYDLLKAQHLRYIEIEEEQEHLAKQWNEAISKKPQDLSRVLGIHLSRLRNWMRKRDFDENRRLSVKEEFSAAPVMREISPYGEELQYYEKIRGGSHFFIYANHFIGKYDVFIKTNQVERLGKYLQYETHWRYESVIETVLFAYFLKFGTQYLSEALFCIAGIMAQHRYVAGRAIMYKIREYAANSEMVMMIDQAQSPTYFLAEALPLIRISGRTLNGIKWRFYMSLKRVFDELNDFTDNTIKGKKENEYD